MHPHQPTRPRLLLTFGGVTVLTLCRAASAKDFQPGCTLPFDSIKEAHPIDHIRPRARGNVPDPPVGANDAAHALQNERKNNFCATGGPALVTFLSFKKLQKKLDQKTPDAKHWTRTNLPADRNVLSDVYTTSENATIGEGSVVPEVPAIERSEVRGWTEGSERPVWPPRVLVRHSPDQRAREGDH